MWWIKPTKYENIALKHGIIQAVNRDSVSLLQQSKSPVAP